MQLVDHGGPWSRLTLWNGTFNIFVELGGSVGDGADRYHNQLFIENLNKMK